MIELVPSGKKVVGISSPLAATAAPRWHEERNAKAEDMPHVSSSRAGASRLARLLGGSLPRSTNTNLSGMPNCEDIVRCQRSRPHLRFTIGRFLSLRRTSMVTTPRQSARYSQRSTPSVLPPSLLFLSIRTTVTRWPSPKSRARAVGAARRNAAMGMAIFAFSTHHNTEERQETHTVADSRMRRRCP